MQQAIFASEAYALLRDIPSPKAWSLDEDGSVTLMGSVVLRRRGAGRLSVRRDGQDTVVPLMIDGEWCRHATKVADALVAGLETAPEPYVAAIRERRTGTAIDRRFSPRSRELLGRIDADGSIDGDMPYRRDVEAQITYLARELMDYEAASLRARIRVSALGFARGPVGCAKLINAYLWADFYDPTIARTAIAAFGRKATTRDYDQIAREWSIPLPGGRDGGIRDMIRTHRPAIVLLDVLRRHRDDSCPSESAAAPTGMSPVPTGTDGLHAGRLSGIVSDAPTILKRAGLKPAVWRMMLRMSDPQIASIKTIFESALGLRGHDSFALDFAFDDAPARPRFDPKGAAVSVLNRMAELGAETAPRTFLRTLAIMPDERRTLLPLYLGGILDGGRAARKRKLVKDQAFTIGLIADAFDALHKEGDAVAHTPNLGWAALSRLSERWHANAEFGSAEALTLAWEPLLPTHATPAASAEELHTGVALAQEGRTMGHCVAGYAHSCAAGGTRIFSLKASKGPHRSTAEYRLGNDRKWRLVQHRTKANKRPQGGLGAWIKSLTSALNKAQGKADAKGPVVPAVMAGAEPMRLAA